MAITLDKSHIRAIEEGIAPPMRHVVTIPAQVDGHDVIIYVCTSPFKLHPKSGEVSRSIVKKLAEALTVRREGPAPTHARECECLGCVEDRAEQVRELEAPASLPIFIVTLHTSDGGRDDAIEIPPCTGCNGSRVERIYGGHGNILEVPCSTCRPAEARAWKP